MMEVIKDVSGSSDSGDNSKVSVIIPVYKVEPYLDRCVNSVLKQTLSDLEIILVDDGSPDHCPQMCDQYALTNSNVKVIHKENGGLASARNAGMRIATGDYIFFLDSDDWLEEDGLQTLYEKAEEKGVDFVRYRAIRSFWPGKADHIPCMVEPIRELEGGLYDRKRILETVYPRLLATEQLTLGPVVGACGSLYKASFLKSNNIVFDEDVKFSEDVIFSARVVRAAHSFFFIDEAGIYHYFYNSKSISKSFRSGRWESCLSLIKACERDFAGDVDYDFSEELHFLRWFCVLLALNERKKIRDFWDRYRYCRGILKDVRKRKIRLSLKGIKISHKQMALLLLVKLRCAIILAFGK